MEDLNQYGVVGILILLILKEVFKFIRNLLDRRSGRVPGCESCGFSQSHNEKRLRELYEWHKPDPETGRFKWYARDGEIIEAVRKVGHDLVHEFREFRKVYQNGKH